MEETAQAIRDELRAHADSARARGQQAYMKSAMPFLGVSVPEARRIARRQVRGIHDTQALLQTARTLWDDATHREERYAALAVLGARPLRGDFELLPVIEHVVRTGQWWDFTDEVAHRVAELLDAHPGELGFIIRRWCADDDLWMRRLAIISQLGRHDRLDLDLLTDVIEANADDGEFFIRKAIGWALREAARRHADWVREFVASHELSALSAREATKHL